MFGIIKRFLSGNPTPKSELSALPVIALSSPGRSASRPTYSSSYAADTSARMAQRMKLQRILEKA
ncbi:hypothetical protein GMLC_31640 [Geomonas limicola]|uniref:Uncharacterized protein n=1 Tax=Geomonas limicola TaxID=2740186 RepID=A0A6V8NAD5_9BACT|nr:hypothetical protein [Geomonas limicola]GFO69585.1 hypothetical protein GMLC_31640 [Geomonas limicola]